MKYIIINHDGITAKYMMDDPDLLLKAKKYALKYNKMTDNKCQNCECAIIARGNIIAHDPSEYDKRRIGYICGEIDTFIKFKSNICIYFKRNINIKI